MPDINYLDDCLSTRDGRLFIEELDTVELVREFGSPIFVLSEDQIRRNVRRFQDAFTAGWSDGPVKVMPAAKANWISAVQRILADEGCGCDIYSSGELTIAPRLLQMEKVKLVGFHQHNGRHHPSLRYWEEQMKAYAREMGRVCQALGG